MNRLLEYFLSLPKTLYFNFRCLPLRKAIRLPYVVRYDTDLQVDNWGGVISNFNPQFHIVHIGFSTVPVCDKKTTTVFKISSQGSIIFNGKMALGHGSKICAHGTISFGAGSGISSDGNIYCYDKISIGDNCSISWGVLLMDSDSHTIQGLDGSDVETKKPIIVGNHVWLCYGVTVLKGAIIPDNCVVGTNSLVKGTDFKSNTIIIGSPAKSKKEIAGWRV